MALSDSVAKPEQQYGGGCSSLANPLWSHDLAVRPNPLEPDSKSVSSDHVQLGDYEDPEPRLASNAFRPAQSTTAQSHQYPTELSPFHQLQPSLDGTVTASTNNPVFTPPIQNRNEVAEITDSFAMLDEENKLTAALAYYMPHQAPAGFRNGSLKLPGLVLPKGTEAAIKNLDAKRKRARAREHAKLHIDGTEKLGALGTSRFALSAGRQLRKRTTRGRHAEELKTIERPIGPSNPILRLKEVDKLEKDKAKDRESRDLLDKNYGTLQHIEKSVKSVNSRTRTKITTETGVPTAGAYSMQQQTPDDTNASNVSRMRALTLRDSDHTSACKMIGSTEEEDQLALEEAIQAAFNAG